MPSGGYLDYQDGYKGFEIGPNYYQDNSYFRTIMPENIENIENRINAPSFLSQASGIVNQGMGILNQLAGMSGQFQNQNNANSSFNFNNILQSTPNSFTNDNVLTGLKQDPITGDLNGGIFENIWNMKKGGKVPKYYNGTGRQSLAMFGNSYGNTRSNPFTFNNNSNRYGAGVYTNAMANDWMHTKLGHDRLEYEDDKIDWGFMNWAKEPTGFLAGTVLNTPIGSITGLDDTFNNSFLSRTTGGKLGKGLGQTGTGAAKIIGGVGTGNIGWIADGAGDLGQGTVGTYSNISAESNMDNWNKEGYISDRRRMNDMDQLNNILDNLGGLFGNLGGNSNSLNLGSTGNNNNFNQILGMFPDGGKVNTDILNKIPVQAEKYKGQPEQIIDPVGNIMSTNAKSSHENMGDNTITDNVIGNSHIQSARNTLKKEEILQLIENIDPSKVEGVKQKLDQIYKDKFGDKKNKELSPASISEYAKKKYQTESTPNSFDAEILKKDRKKDYSNLSIQLNDLINIGNNLANDPQTVQQFKDGTAKDGVQPINSNIWNLKDPGFEFGNIGVDHSMYSPLLIPQGIKDYNYFNPNNLQYNDPNFSSPGWNPLSDDAFEWFRTNAQTMNIFEGADDKFYSSKEYKKFEKLRNNPDKYSFKEKKKIMDEVQGARQEFAYNLNNKFFDDVIATAYVPTWNTLKKYNSNKKFREALKNHDIDITTAGGYSKLKNLTPEERNSLYSNLSDTERKDLSKSQVRDHLWDRRMENFRERNFNSMAQRDAWLEANNLKMHDSGWAYDPNNPNNVIIPKVYRRKQVDQDTLNQWSTLNNDQQLPNTVNDNLSDPYKNVIQDKNVFDNYYTPPIVPNSEPVEQTPTPQQPFQPTPIENINVPYNKNFYNGLLQQQLNTGLSANALNLQQGLAQSPLYYMETPDTYIRSRINEIPTDNIVYNLERNNRNTNQFLRDNTGDWATLAGNTLNNTANMYNQLGNQLHQINRENVNLYNTTQDKQQGLLENNMTVRNRNLHNMQEMMNYKKNLIGQHAKENAELYSNYYDSMNTNRQKEDNQKLEMASIMASNPDMFKGQQGQLIANEVLGRTGTYDNQFINSPLLDMLGGNSMSNLSTVLNIFKKEIIWLFN